MKRPRKASRILYRIEDDSRYEWQVTAELLALPAAQETALQIRKNGLEILVCTAEEFNEKGLPETYEAEEYFTDGLQFSAQEQALEETNTSTKPYDEG